MPSTLVGLLVAVYVLIPGYCYYAVRRRTVPTRPLSTAVEGANLLVVAMVASIRARHRYIGYRPRHPGCGSEVTQRPRTTASSRSDPLTKKDAGIPSRDRKISGRNDGSGRLTLNPLIVLRFL